MKQELEKLECPIIWGEGQPECTLVKTILTAKAIVPSRGDFRWNVITFKNPVSAKHGSPNDEVIDAHPLTEIGLESGEFYILHGSHWKDELKSINSTHPNYDQELWKTMNHYIFVFRESILECIASDFTVYQSGDDYVTVMKKITDNICIVSPESYKIKGGS
jgi:hypothetical protein